MNTVSADAGRPAGGDLITGSVASVPSLSAPLITLLTDYADLVCTHQPVPGGVLVVVDRVGVQLLHPFGLADLGAQRAVAPGDLFEIGSISKSLTAMLVNQLVDEGILTLDDLVSQWLPWVDLGRHGAHVSLRQLLSHTGGLVMGGESMPDPVAQAWTLRDRDTFEAGTRFHYSNLGYVLLGLVLTAATGSTLAELLQHRLFGPLGLSAALGRVTHADRPLLATGYATATDDRPWAPGDDLAPATWLEAAGADGNAALSGPDLARYLRLLLGDGSLDGQVVLSAEALGRIATPQAPTGEDVLEPPGYPPVTSSRYGLGLNVERVGDHDCLTHGGGMVGYSSFVLADRSAGLGIGVLTNADGDGPAAHLLARVVHQVLLSEQSGGPLPALVELARVDPAVRVREIAPGLLGRFTALPGGGDVQVEPVGEQVVVRTAAGTGRLWRTLGGRYLTDHRQLRRFALDPTADGLGWVHGPTTLRPLDEVAAPEPDLTPEHAAFVGHYRSWTPWFTNFRIVARDGVLYLVAPGGVEAPAGDQELVALAPGLWRIGADEWLPERLTEIARVDGQVVIMDRDGARYSRTFTP